MKKINVVILLILIFCSNSFAQSNANPNNKMDSIKYTGQTEQYCLLVCTSKMFSTKVNVDMDFGQATSMFSANRQSQIRDDLGKLKKFDSVVDALHYLNSRGWIFVSAYPMSSTQGQCYHYLMKRAIPKGEISETH